MKQIAIFHRNCLFRDCLANYLEYCGEFQATALGHDSTDLGDDPDLQGTDIILLDTNLPEGRAKQILDCVRAASPDVKVVLLVPDDHQSLFDCMAGGVQGCVLERSSLEELRRAIECVDSGDVFCSSEFAKLLFSEVTRRGPAFTWQMPSSTVTTRLTLREQEILDLIGQRKCNKEIAKELSVSLHTVKNHVHKILQKLQVGNRIEAAKAARQENLLTRL